MNNKELKNYMTRQRIKTERSSSTDFLNSGSTLLNLACSDNPFRGYVKGHYYRLVGDSRSGKTFLCLTALAEATINSSFDNYDLIYDNVEKGAMMDFEKFFGKKAKERIKAPSYNKKGKPKYSTTIEEFYYNLDNALKTDKPCIYVLDSESSISSDKEIQEFEESKKAYESNKIIGGSYGDGKAKIHSAQIKRYMNVLEESGSILILVSQTRDKLTGYGGKGVSGGWALLFYAGLEIWCSVKDNITKTILGKKRIQGTLCSLRVKKNRISGKDRNVTMPIYPSYGIDDTGSCIDYLVDEKHWSRSGSLIQAEDFEVEPMKRESLIKWIESENKERELRKIVGRVWNEIENKIALKRKKRYE